MQTSKFVFKPRTEDEDIFDLICRNYGSIFGGYIRDVLLHSVPNDIDCVVEQKAYPAIETGLKKMGYEKAESSDLDVIKFVHNDRIPVEIVIEQEETHETCILGPCAEPDVDVNNLCWAYHLYDDKYELSSWVDPNAFDFVEKVVERLLNDEKSVFVFPNIPQDRREKILAKGFKIFGEINTPIV